MSLLSPAPQAWTHLHSAHSDPTGCCISPPASHRIHDTSALIKTASLCCICSPYRAALHTHALENVTPHTRLHAHTRRCHSTHSTPHARTRGCHSTHSTPHTHTQGCLHYVTSQKHPRDPPTSLSSHREIKKANFRTRSTALISSFPGISIA